MKRISERRTHPQGGSAYLATLLVLFVLTIFGLSLAVITQTEREIGVNEQTIARTFFAADSGSASSIAFLLTANDFSAKSYEVSRNQLGSLAIRDMVSTSRLSIHSSGPCNLCQINQGTEGFLVNHRLTSTAQRVAGNGVLAQKRITQMFEVQPRQMSADSAYEGPLQYP